MRGAVSKAGLAMAGLGAVGLSAVAGIVGVSADLATKFQSDMALVHTQAGATTGEVQTMGQALIDLAPTVGLGPDALAQDLFHLESAGFRGKTALDALKVAAEGAQVGHANLEDVTNSLDAVLVAGGSDAKDFSGSMGELNAIVGAGDMHMQDLADAMGTGILATAHTFGLSLKDVGGALATFGDNNIRGSHAANLLRMAISLMGAPSAAAGKALKGIGLGATTLANDMRSGGLTKALADLKAHLADSGKTASEQAAVLSRAFGGGRSSAGILVLLDQLSRVKSKTLEIGKTGGTFGSDWKATTETAAQQMADVKASIDAAGTALGTAFLPIISKVLTTVMPFVQGLATWVNHNQKLAAMILIVTGAVFGLLIPLGLLMAAVATIGGPILAVIGAIALIILVLTHWNQTVQIVQSVIARLGPFVQTAFAALLEFFQALVPKVAAALMAMGKQMLATLADILPKAVKAALDIGQKLIRAIADQLSHLPELAGLWFGRLLSFLLGLPAQLIPIAAAIGTAIITGIIRFGPTILADAITFFAQLSGFLVTLPTKFAGLALGIAGAFVKGFIQGLGSLPNQVGKVLHGVPLLGNLMDIGGSGLGAVMSHLPHFAAGGLVSSPTIALIGENGPEAVVPLHGGEGIATNLAGLGMESGFGGDESTHTIYLQIDGRTLARIVDQHLGRTRALRGSSLAG